MEQVIDAYVWRNKGRSMTRNCGGVMNYLEAILGDSGV